MRDKKHYTIHLVTVLQFLNACPKYLCNSLINFLCLIVWTQLTEQNGMYAMSWREQRSADFSASQISCAKSTLPSQFLQGSKSFLNVYQNFKTISRVFSIISWVVASMTSWPCWHQWQVYQQYGYGLILNRDWSARLKGYFASDWSHLWLPLKGTLNQIKILREPYMKHTFTKLGEGNESTISVLGNYLTELKLRYYTSGKGSSRIDTQPELLQLPQADEDDCRLVDMVSISKIA